MSTNILDLKQGNVYLIRHDFDKYRHYEGTFIETRTINGKLSPEFTNCVCYIRQVEHINNYSDSDYRISHYQNDSNPINIFCDPIRTRYYDAVKVKTFDKVKNLQKAIQSRERRSANMILKRLVNEDFEW
jgi:hypothetical protein